MTLAKAATRPVQLNGCGEGCMKLATLLPVEIRSIWAHEASDFTPWLARKENIQLLGETLNIGALEVEATERDVGRFSADIVAKDENGWLVLIENQLEQTDHRHLGQLLTYLAGLEGEATVVWIATHFLEEHTAAIDWLNENTNESYDFFGVEIAVVRIGDSEPAPVFNVTAKPNGWSRDVRSVTRQASEGPVTDRQKLLLVYWAAFADFLQGVSPHFKAPKPGRDHWKSFGIGKSGFNINYNALAQFKRLGVELYISRPTAKADFKALYSQRDQLEEAFGEELVWEELPGKKGSRISVSALQADPADEPDWPRQFAWAHGKLSKFRQVFSAPIQALNNAELPLSDYVEDVDS